MTFAMVKGQLQIVDGMWVDSLLNYDVKDKSVIIDGKYKVLEIIGQGGMGTVYKAEQIKLGRSVALKTFRSREIPPDVWRRFEREARAVAQLDHENVIKVYDFGITEDNRPYYTMELLSGESLEERLDRHGALSLSEFYYVFARVFEALKYTHEKNIVHRDIKPANVFLTLKNEQITGVKLVDFGIAGLVKDMGTADQKLTDTGTIFGSPLYMSPEQSRGENLDGRTDIYSCGCMLFECLTELPPFRGKSALETIIMHQGTPVPPLPAKTERGENIPDWLSKLYGLMMQKEKDNRIGSCAEIFDVMSFQLKGKTQSARTATIPKQEIEKSPDKSRTSRVALFACLLLLACGLSAGIFWDKIKDTQFKKSKGNKANVEAASSFLSIPKEYSEVDFTSPVEPDTFEPFRIKTKAGELCFQFPKTAIGTIEVSGKSGTGKVAKGKVCFAEGDDLCFTNDINWPRYARQWRCFAPGDLVGITVTTGKMPLPADHLQEICRKSSLTELYLEDTDIGAPLIDEINKLPYLISLKIHDGKLKPEDYIRLKRLPWLWRLNLFDCTDISDILDKLTSKNNDLMHLTVTGCKLKDQDFETIAKMKRLAYLDLTNTNATGSQLAKLTNLDSLQSLFLNCPGISAADVPIIARFKNLKFLRVNPSWTRADIEKIKAKFPKNKIDVSGPTPEGTKETIETFLDFKLEKL